MLLLTAFNLFLVISAFDSSGPFMKDRLEINGTYSLGGVFTVHAPGTDSFSPCSSLDEYTVVLTVATEYALEYYNRNVLDKKGLTLGLLAYDNCYSPQFAIQEMLTFIPSLDDGVACHSQYDSSATYNHYFAYNNTSSETNIVATVGSPTSQGAVSGTSLLEYFCLPLISSDSTSSDLDNALLFPYFFRTVPSDHYQAGILAKILDHFKWRNVLIYYQYSIYGRTLLNSFRQFKEKTSNKVCVVEKAIAIGMTDSVAEWNRTIRNLNSYCKSYSAALLLFDITIAKQFFNALDVFGSGKAKRMQFVGPDGWSSSDFVTKDLEHLVNGSITVEGIRKEVPGFKEYVENLTLNQTGNPWLREMISLQRNCCVMDANNTCNATQKTECTDNMRLVKVDLEGLNRAHFAVEAVAAVAESIITLCADDTVCSNLTGPNLRAALLNVSISNSLTNFTFFDGSNSGLPHFSIYQNQGGNWVDIGTGNGDIGEIYVHEKLLMITEAIKEARSNSCERKCEGLTQNVNRNSTTCCWRCEACERYMRVIPNQGICEKCAIGMIGDIATNYTTCTQDQLNYVSFKAATTIIAIILASVGLILSCGGLVWLWIQRETPLFKALNVFLCGAIGVATLFQFLTPFILLIPPNTVTCILSRAFCQLSSALALTALAVKTAGAARKNQQLQSTTSVDDCRGCQSINSHNKLQVCLGVMVQVISILFWALLDRPVALPQRINSSTYVICSMFEEPRNLITYTWLIILATTSLYYSARMQKAKLEFVRKEGRWLSVASFGFILATIFVTIPLNVTPLTPPTRMALELLDHLLVAYIFLSCAQLPMPVFSIRRPYKNTTDYVRRKHIGVERRGLYIVDVCHIDDYTGRSRARSNNSGSF